MIQTGYTKHYYAGTERLATVIGGGGFSDIITPIETLSSQEVDDIVEPFYSHYEHHTYDPFYYEDALNSDVVKEDVVGTQQQDLPYQCQPIALEFVEALATNDILINAIYDNEQVNDIETEIYFYHGDHLGSANWITDAYGEAIQYIHYAPYGELIANQQVAWYDERYKFTGKERDAESGYDFFGARFCSSLRPYSGIFSYTALSPVRIETEGFALKTDSCSLKYDIDIRVTKLPYKGGTAMRSSMVNISAHGDGIRLLPNGEHFSEATF